VELRESELFSIGYDHRVCPEEVHAIFYDSGRDKDVIFSFFERVDTVFDLFTCHATVESDDAGYEIPPAPFIKGEL